MNHETISGKIKEENGVNRLKVMAVIEMLEQDPSFLKANWCLPSDEARLIYLLAKLGNAQEILEIGTSIGYSGLWLGLAALENGGKLITLDAHPGRLDQAKDNFSKAGLLDGIEIRCGEALNLLQTIELERFESQPVKQQGKPFDLIFVDAQKSEYLQYFQWGERFLKPGGLFIADNTVSHRSKMLDFIQRIQGNPKWESSDLQTPNGLLIARKLLD
ncbi:MAG: class I SAM-dependent methyltransferase [Cyanobacteria bacterium]|nr:class I SAM-dependent methyltransferase [Cyanobacteriota bacterium]